MKKSDDVNAGFAALPHWQVQYTVFLCRMCEQNLNMLWRICKENGLSSKPQFGSQKRSALFPGGRKQDVLIDANEKSLRKGDKIKEKRLSAWEKGELLLTPIVYRADTL